MLPPTETFYQRALDDFKIARRQATLEQIIARFTRRSSELLSYEDVKQKLGVKERGELLIKDIPLDSIVGSVGRYTDFTRSFLPKKSINDRRWAQVRQAMTGMIGLPPIEVYQIGDVYFVLDGNHRVSVARQLGATHIEAYVTEFHTRVPLLPNDQPDDLLLKAEFARFLEKTSLDESRPEADLRVTNPGQYRELEEHIIVHRYYMGIEQQREISFEEAAAHWYDKVFMPMVEIIRQRGILTGFPGRTESDIYVWVSRHRAELEEELGMPIETDSAVVDLVPKQENIVSKVIDLVTPEGLESGPETGAWREGRLNGRQDRLFRDIVVPVSGLESGWQALDQAMVLARREGARLYGLHVEDDHNDVEGEAGKQVQSDFEKRCREAGVEGNLSLTTGRVARRICERARWADLVVLNLAHPPSPQPLAKLSSGFRTLIRLCPSPVFAVPGKAMPLERALLAYDGSLRAEEALFVSAYLCSRWEIQLVVLTVAENGQPDADTIERAKAYLEKHDVEYVEMKNGLVGEAILETAECYHCDFILMGSYGHSPIVEMMLGSTVDHVLRESHIPILICH
jgi:nucleotide-binding universal stress UspA family protein